VEEDLLQTHDRVLENLYHPWEEMEVQYILQLQLLLLLLGILSFLSQPYLVQSFLDAHVHAHANPHVLLQAEIADVDIAVASDYNNSLDHSLSSS
jgi:hypothetical protein